MLHVRTWDMLKPYLTVYGFDYEGDEYCARRVLSDSKTELLEVKDNLLAYIGEALWEYLLEEGSITRRGR
jgi:hypothetical protein